jgi:hypothetical protein
VLDRLLAALLYDVRHADFLRECDYFGTSHRFSNRMKRAPDGVGGHFQLRCTFRGRSYGKGVDVAKGDVHVVSEREGLGGRPYVVFADERPIREAAREGAASLVESGLGF